MFLRPVVVYKKVNGIKNLPMFRERDILFIFVGLNIGSEQNGHGEMFLRPVLIYKKLSKTLFIGIPLTSTKKTGSYYVSFILKGRESIALLLQIKMFYIKRIEYFHSRLGRNTFQFIKKRLIKLLD